MKITEYSIMEYGPLKETGKIKLENFNLFYGKNEDGKTLTVEAIIKHLFRNDSNIFRNIQRVDDNPSGYIKLKDNGTEIKLSKRNNFQKITGLTAREAQSIFIIRNSDLSSGHDKDFYEQITDRLTNLQTSKIEKIIKKLRENGNITKTGDFSSTKKNKKFGSQIIEAKESIDKINTFIKSIQEKDYDNLDIQLAKVIKKQQSIRDELTQLRLAEKREKFQKGSKALNNLQRLLKELENLKNLTSDDYSNWIQMKAKQEKDEERLQKLKEELINNKKHLVQIDTELQNKMAIQTALLKVKNRLDDFDDKIENYKTLRIKEVTREKNIKSCKKLISGAFTVFVLSLIGLIVQSQLLGLFLLFLALSFTAILFPSLYCFKLYTESNTQEKLLEDIKLTAAKNDIKTGSFEEIINSYEKFKDKYQAIDADVIKLGSIKTELEKKIRIMEGKEITEIEDEINKRKNRIEKIKEKTGIVNLSDYKSKLNRKRQIEHEINTEETKLSELLEGGNTYLEIDRKIEFYKNRINDLKRFQYEAKDVQYDSMREDKLKDEENKLNDTINDLNNKLNEVRNEIIKIVSSIGLIDIESFLLAQCQSLSDIIKVREALSNFVAVNEKKRKNYLKVIEIFEELNQEEMEKVKQLFSDGLVADIFKKMSDGLYIDVYLDEDCEIVVERKDKTKLSVYQISSGTYDQLYFAIRLALGKKLLKDNSGFLILDDPFIKYDYKRLKKQLDILKDIIDEGWQILLFTAKKEVYDLLKPDIESGMVKVIPVGCEF